jgi:hypothetical protein
MDCFAEPVIGRRFAPTRWLAMTVSRLFEIVVGLQVNTLVMPGLDPGIHPSSQDVPSKGDGLPGQARQ